MDRPETRYAWNGDVALAHQVLGEGSVDLVYMQGVSSHVDLNWESPFLARFLRGLGQQARVIHTDRRGFGCSDRFSPGDVAKWRDPIEEHDRIAKGIIGRFRGTYVRGTGDGLLATSDGPARAVRCAEALVEAVKPLGIEIRAGLHTGEIESGGHDLAGVGVNIGARAWVPWRDPRRSGSPQP